MSLYLISPWIKVFIGTATTRLSRNSADITHCKCTVPKIFKPIFPETKLFFCSLVPNFYIHVSVSDLYIPTIGPQTQCSKIGGPIVQMYNCAQIHECRNSERGRAVSFLGIFVSNLRCSASESNCMAAGRRQSMEACLVLPRIVNTLWRILYTVQYVITSFFKDVVNGRWQRLSWS